MSSAPERGIRSSLLGPLTRIWVVVRTHWLFAGALLVATALRVLVVIAYRPAFFFTGDSVVYLNNSTHLFPQEARPLLYAVFLRTVLTGHSLLLVPVLQHVMGLACAVITYVLLQRLEVRRGWAVIATVFVLFDPLQLVMEHNILSDCLFQLLVVATLALLMWNRRPPVWVCALAGVGVAAATLTRNIGLVLIVPVFLYVLLRRFGWVRIVTVLLAFGLPLLAYAGWFDSLYGHFSLQNYGGKFLYGRVAPFAECHGLALSKVERSLCPPPGPRSQWPTWYVFGPPSPFLKEPLASDPATNQIAMGFAQKVILNQPTRYAAAVGRDFGAWFNPVRTTGPDADPVSIDFQFRLSTLTAYASPLITNWIKEADNSPGARAVVVRPVARVLHDWQRDFYFPGPLFALSIVLGCAGLAGRQRRARRNVGPEGLTYALTATLLLLGPVATVVFDYRFLVPALPLLGTSAVLGLSSLSSRVRTPAGVPCAAGVTDVTGGGESEDGLALAGTPKGQLDT